MAINNLNIYDNEKNCKKIFIKMNFINYGVVKKKLLEIINLLRPLDLGYNYIRLGGKTDGSYIVPEILDEINYCFSAGYGGTVLSKKFRKIQY